MKKDNGKDENISLQQKIDPQVQIFLEQKQHLENFSELLKASLKKATATLPGHPMVSSRVKDLGSFVGKCIRKDQKYHSPAWQLTDLCAARVIVLSKDAIPAIQQAVESLFLITEQEDAGRRLGQMAFGYQSMHYVVALDPQQTEQYRLALGTEDIDHQLLASRTESEARAQGLQPGPKFRAEIQIRTLLQHAWSGAVHDNLYKTDLKKIPPHIERQSARISALLEEADDAIVSLVAGIKEYRSYYGAYLTPEEIKHEIEMQRLILRYKPESRAALLKIARLTDCLQESDGLTEAEQLLARLENSQDADVHRELGVIRCRRGQKEGRVNLEKSSALAPNNADTWCELAKTYLPTREYGKALNHYYRALEANPEYPRTLMRLIECEILYGKNNPLNALAMLKSNLERAITVSHKRIAAGMHLPHAWYDVGFFHLLLQRPFASLDAYGKALLVTASSDMAIQVYDSLTRIHEMVYDKAAALDQVVKLIRSFLRIVLVGRFGLDADTYLHSGEPHLDGSVSLAPSRRDTATNPFATPGPVVIVAGSCSAESQPVIDGYAPILREALTSVHGTLCSGGTANGVSGIVGALPDQGGKVRKLGYLPMEGQAMPGYTCIRTASGTFSPLDPLMFWADYLAAGRDPREVRILCFRGGDIAACECQIGLLLGARVAVLPESGGACERLATDPDWTSARALDGSGRNLLLRLPVDPETLQTFLVPATSSGLLDETTREKLAAAIHENYCQQARQDMHKSFQNIAPWQHLDETFKKANLGQVDQIEHKLRRIGFTLELADSKEMTFQFSQEEVERLADMEHGRWVVERLEEGWTLGERNDTKKTRPQLICWDRLPLVEKKKDYQAIRDLPKVLALAGYRITRR